MAGPFSRLPAVIHNDSSSNPRIECFARDLGNRPQPVRVIAPPVSRAFSELVIPPFVPRPRGRGGGVITNLNVVSDRSPDTDRLKADATAMHAVPHTSSVERASTPHRNPPQPECQQ